MLLRQFRESRRMACRQLRFNRMEAVQHAFEFGFRNHVLLFGVIAALPQISCFSECNWPAQGAVTRYSAAVFSPAELREASISAAFFSQSSTTWSTSAPFSRL